MITTITPTTMKAGATILNNAFFVLTVLKLEIGIEP